MHKFNLKHILLIVLIFSLLFVQVSSEPISKNKAQISSTKQIKKQITSKHVPVNKTKSFKKPAQSSNAKKPKKALTPKKYRKNFVIRIPRTKYRADGPKRITITRTTPPATIEYEIPTHTSEETTTYYSTFGFDFISPSPQPSRVYKRRKSQITNVNVKNNTIPITKAP